MTASSPIRRRARVAALAAVVVLALTLLAPVAAADTEPDPEAELAVAIEQSRAQFDDGEAEGAVVARVDEFADARAGSSLSDAVGGPLLLTDPDELDDDTATELSRAVNRDGTVHLLGGTAALSADVAAAVADLGFDVERHGGATRFETAEAIAHAVAGLREFAIEDVDTRGHPDEVIVSVTRSPTVRDTRVSPDAWSLTEEGEERQVELADTGSSDLAVMLILDVDDTVGDGPTEAAQQAATGFVNQMPNGARVGVVSSTPQAALLQAPTDDRDANRDALNGFEPGEGSDLHGAVELSLDRLADAQVPAVVVLSDGTGGERTSGTVRLVEEAGATVHVIELLSDDSNTEALEALAQAGKGRRVPAGDPNALAPLYDDLAYELVGPQRLIYASETGGETEITVAVRHATVSEEASATITLPPAPSRIDVGFLAGDAGILIGAALLYVAMAMAILVLLAPRPGRAQLAGARQHHRELGGGRRTWLAGLADRVVGSTEDSLRRRGKRSAINAALERAGITLRPGEVVVLAACLALATFTVGLALVAWWLGLLLAVVTLLVVRMVVRHLGERRQKQFIEQLSDTLQLLSGSLRAGYGLQQALDAAAKEADKPTSEELHRLLVEVRLGRDLMEALEAMADRMGSEDFAWVVQAIGIQREVGGDLAEVLDTVAATVRERGRIRRQVKALSAEGRLSAWVLFVLPFAVGAFIAIVNPSYLAELTNSVMGYTMIGVATGLLIAGGLWLRNIVNLEY